MIFFLKRTGRSGPGADDRKRFVLGNLLKLAAVVVVAVISLGLLRQYGLRLSAREKADTLLDQAAGHFKNANLYHAQHDLLLALNAHRPIGAGIVLRFQDWLPGMPPLRDALQAAMANVNTSEAVRFYLADASIGQAAELLESLDGTEEARPLWQARLLLEEGDYARAKERFDAYWRTAPMTPQELNAAVMPTGETTASEVHHAARRLFKAGAWTQAFAAFQSAEKRGLDVPDVDFFQGVALELRGEKEKALEAYMRTLERQPNHIDALHRAAALSAGL